jgi:hypothetical protein
MVRILEGPVVCPETNAGVVPPAMQLSDLSGPQSWDHWAWEMTRSGDGVTFVALSPHWLAGRSFPVRQDRTELVSLDS